MFSEENFIKMKKLCLNTKTSYKDTIIDCDEHWCNSRYCVLKGLLPPTPGACKPVNASFVDEGTNRYILS